MREKMAVVAPIPRAKVRMIVTENPGAFRSWRRARRKSRIRARIHAPREVATDVGSLARNFASEAEAAL
jgi:hypothetical protein